jgi:hypothetical protein
MFRTKAIVLFATLSVATVSNLQAQSLAEAAQKEAARRKTVKGTARVITNKDLPNVLPATASAPDQTATPAAPAAGSASAASGTAEAKDDQAPKDGAAGEKHDEKYWRDRLTKAKDDLDHNRIYADALQSKINALTTEVVNRDDPAQRAVLETDRQRFVAELDRLRKATVDGTKAIGAIEEEARRAGVPPGWLR